MVCTRCESPFERLAIAFPTRRFICPACVREEREAEEEAERLVREENRRRMGIKLQERILDNLKKAGVNVWDHHDASLDSFDSSECGPVPVEAARTFIAAVKAAGKYDQVRGLYLWGDTGAGKSHLAVSIARELLLDQDFGGEVVYDHALRLIGRIQRTYSSDESADAVLDRRINAGVWILDDLGTENPSADVVRRLTEIFTERAMRPTVVTSNLDPAALEARHSELFRVSSRMGPRYFRTVEVKGRDRRHSS